MAKMPGPEPVAVVVVRGTAETPPKGAEIHRVPRDWGEEISFIHGGKVQRFGLTEALDSVAVKRLVAERRIGLDSPPDIKGQIAEAVAFHEDVVAQLKAELEDLG